jgi:hypothetical protein
MVGNGLAIGTKCDIEGMGKRVYCRGLLIARDDKEADSLRSPQL